jgi:8-oxo-dGTP pyrophosphatase MutT (NUDIX family)
MPKDLDRSNINSTRPPQPKVTVVHVDPRDQILSLIHQYGKTNPSEQDVVERIAEFVQAHENCFSREQLLGHITGSVWILDKSMTKSLLTHHKKLNIWVQLGGHADGDSDVQRVAMKEAEEESGIANLVCLSPDIFDIDIHRIPERKTEPEHYHYDCRFLLQSQDDEYVVSEESHDLSWIELTKMKDYTTEESVLRMVRKTQTFLK